jgi:hypothetical protein
MATLASDGSQADVITKIAAAAIGDTVTVPSGIFVWGAGGSQVTINKQITVQGDGIGSTVIQLSDTGPDSGSSRTGVIKMNGHGARLCHMSVEHESANDTDFLLVESTAYGFRVDHVDYDRGASTGNGITCYTEGLIDNCAGDVMPWTAWGLSNPRASEKWQYPRRCGTQRAVYVEDCALRNVLYGENGYGASVVTRNCTFANLMKIDVHGIETNTRSGRWFEVYRCDWTSAGGGSAELFDIRGGTGMIWGNSCASASNYNWFRMKTYGALGDIYGNLDSKFWTPNDSPVYDQVGMGDDTLVTPMGAEPVYIWNNRQSGNQWPLLWQNVAAGALALYQTQEGDGGASFGMDDMIVADRDYFLEDASFNGSSGMGVGTRAQMDAITPTTIGVGFWVTNEGSWDSNLPGTSGRLYKWSGTAWVLEYEPYPYPHPLRNGTPTFEPAKPTSLVMYPQITFA